MALAADCESKGVVKTFVGEIGIAVVVGVVVGGVGAWLLVRANKAGWVGAASPS